MAYLHCQTRTQMPTQVWITIPKMGTVMIRDPNLDWNQV